MKSGRKTKNSQKWKVKYYKGLGTSTSREAKEYFKEMNVAEYIWNDEECSNSIEAFFNKNADGRKVKLEKYDFNNTLDNNVKKVAYKDFFDKEFIHFSNEDLKRSIGSLCDGNKPSQRKNFI